MGTFYRFKNFNGSDDGYNKRKKSEEKGNSGIREFKT